MGLLGLVTTPLTAPVRAGWWLMEQVAAAAEAELHDPRRVAAELRALEEEVGAQDAGEEKSR